MVFDDELVFDEDEGLDLDGVICLSDEDCVEDLIQDAPPGCLYCALRDLDDEED